MVLFAAAAVDPADEILTNENILSMTRAGLPPAVIVAKIRQTRASYDVSATTLGLLAKAGVAEPVLAAMLESSQASSRSAAGPAPEPAPEPESLWLVGQAGAGETLTRLELAVYNSRFSAGLFHYGMKVVLPGKLASVRTTTRRPVFEFRLSTGSSPSRYILSRLEESDEGGGRQLDLDSAEVFDAAPRSAGVFRVVPRRDLKKGEWCFYWGTPPVAVLGIGAPGHSDSFRVFDFGVDQAPKGGR